MPSQIWSLCSMIGSNLARSGSSSGSPSAGAQLALTAASTGAIRWAYSSM